MHYFVTNQNNNNSIANIYAEQSKMNKLFNIELLLRDIRAKLDNLERKDNTLQLDVKDLKKVTDTVAKTIREVI